MSGSGYDTTTVFGFKKPWVNADDDQWGTHINQNMDLLDNLLNTSGFNPAGYLPLTGGIVTGVTTFNHSGNALVVQNQAQFGQVNTGILNVTGTAANVVTGVGITNFMASPPPIGTLLQNQVVSSALWVRKSMVLSPGAPYAPATAPMSMSLAASGATPNFPGGYPLMRWVLSSDNVDARNVGEVQGGVTNAMRMFDIQHVFGGAGTFGFRQLMQLRISQSGPTDNSTVLDALGRPGDSGIQGLSVSSTSSFNEGGTPTYPRGHNFAFGTYSVLHGVYDTADPPNLLHGATNWTSNVGCEWDSALLPGSSALRNIGFSIVHLLGHASQGWLDDSAILFGDQGHVDDPPGPALFGWRNLLQIGSSLAQDPLGPNSAIIRWKGASHPGDKIPQAQDGIDIALGAISGNAWNSRNFKVAGSGKLTTFMAELDVTAAGIALDVKNQIINLSSLISGGTPDFDYELGDWFGDPNTGLIVSTSSLIVGGTASVGNTIAAVVQQRVGYAPTNPGTIVLNNLNEWIGGQITVATTGTVLRELSLQPSGGPTKLGGPININGGFVVGGTPGAGGTIAVTGSSAPLIISDGVTVYPPAQGSTALWIMGAASTRLAMDTATSSGTGNQFTARRSNGTPAAPAASSGGIITHQAIGHDGTAYTTTRAAYAMNVQGTFTPTNNGTYHTWSGTPVNTVVAAEQMRLQNNNLAVFGVISEGVSNGVTLTGTSQATAFQFTNGLNILSSVPPGSGGNLPLLGTAALAGAWVDIFNTTTAAAKVYAAQAGQTVDGTASTVGVTLSGNARCRYFANTGSTWVSSLLGAPSA